MTAIYPQYETRGELGAAVSRFREWLQNTVIDIEVEVGTPSPTVDPSVHTILVGHSMGGIVAADTLLAILDDDLVHGRGEKLPFPHVTGILAFDTPYLGLAPGVFAHSAEGKWKTASAAYTSFSSIASGLFATQAAVESTVVLKSDAQEAARSREKPKVELSSQSLWGKWGKVAAYSGAAAALAAGAGAAYVKREEIGAGFGWVSSHMEFVGALMKAEELKTRAHRISTTDGVGFANCFTSLGGERMGTSMMFEGKERTFCSLPAEESDLRKKFYRCVNVKAEDEVGAHVSMFEPKANPAYYDLADRARSLVCLWVKEDSFLPVEEDEYSSYAHATPALLRSSSHLEKESRSSKSSRRTSHDMSRPEPDRADSSSRSEKKERHSHKERDSPDERPRRTNSGPSRSESFDEREERPKKAERSQSSLSKEERHREKEERHKEKEERRVKKEERHREKEERERVNGMMDRTGSELSALSLQDDRKKGTGFSSKEKKDIKRREAEYQMDHDQNPWK